MNGQSSRALRSTRAGDAFIWHNRNGWHFRVRHNNRTKMTFTGTIKTNDGKPIDARAYRLEAKHGDTFSVSADKTTVTFLFNNFGALDGLDMNMHCSGSVTFDLSVNAAPMNPDRIHLGAPSSRGLLEPAHDHAAQVAPPSNAAVPAGTGGDGSGVRTAEGASR